MLWLEWIWSATGLGEYVFEVDIKEKSLGGV
jgi:hypothetical protein